MKQPPKGAKFIRKSVPKVNYLQEIFGRLTGEVRILIDAGRQCRTGYYSSLRMLMPIIESVACVEAETPQELLERHLNIVTPNLVWDLFRHALTHNDIPHYAEYNGMRANWSVGLNGQPHRFERGPKWVYIDGVTLYNDLVHHLDDLVFQNDTTLIDVDVGVEYEAPKQVIVEDFDKLS